MRCGGRERGPGEPAVRDLGLVKGVGRMDHGLYLRVFVG